jgi:hypothetical protein
MNDYLQSVLAILILLFLPECIDLNLHIMYLQFHVSDGCVFVFKNTLYLLLLLVVTSLQVNDAFLQRGHLLVILDHACVVQRS